MILGLLAIACAPTPDSEEAVLYDDTGFGEWTDDSGEDTDHRGDDTGDAEPVDDDEDGWPLGEDCDDGDSTVHPGVPNDVCDGTDEDCDGQTDEDADPDDNEPNDQVATDLGDIDGSAVVVYGEVFPEDDVDRFEFWVEDGWFDVFGVDIELVGVPVGVDLALTVWFDGESGWEEVGTADSMGLGGSESFAITGSSFDDDTGWYRVEITANAGAICGESYALDIEG